MRFAAALTALCLFAPITAHAEGERGLADQVLEMPLPSLQAQLEARAESARIVRKVLKTLKLEDARRLPKAPALFAELRR